MKKLILIAFIVLPFLCIGQSKRLVEVSNLVFDYYLTSIDGGEVIRIYGDTCCLVIDPLIGYNQEDLIRHTSYLAYRGSYIKQISKNPLILKTRRENLFIEVYMGERKIYISLYER